LGDNRKAISPQCHTLGDNIKHISYCSLDKDNNFEESVTNINKSQTTYHATKKYTKVATIKKEYFTKEMFKGEFKYVYGKLNKDITKIPDQFNTEKILDNEWVTVYSYDAQITGNYEDIKFNAYDIIESFIKNENVQFMKPHPPPPRYYNNPIGPKGILGPNGKLSKGIKDEVIIDDVTKFSVIDQNGKIYSLDISDLVIKCGTTDSKPKKIIKVEHATGNKIVRLDKHTIDEKGHIQNSNIIDSTNKLFIKADSTKDVQLSRFGFKIINSDDKPAVAILYVPQEASVAWGEGVKFRTNKVTTLGIFRLVKNGEKYYVIPHNCRELCKTCYNNEAEYQTKSCGHTLCNDCIKSSCCGKSIDGATLIDKTYIVEGETSYFKSKKIKYVIGETIIENDFVGDLKKVCVPGIHYAKFPTEITIFLGDKIVPECKNVKNLIELSELSEIVLSSFDLSKDNETIVDLDVDEFTMKNISEFNEKKTNDYKPISLIDIKPRIPIIDTSRVPIINPTSELNITDTNFEKLFPEVVVNSNNFEKLFPEVVINSNNFEKLFPEVPTQNVTSEKDKQKLCIND